MPNIPTVSLAQVKPIFMRKIMLSLAVLSAIPSAAQANLLTNGNFESPIVPTGAFTSFVTGSVLIPGWTVTGPAGTSVPAPASLALLLLGMGGIGLARKTFKV